MVPTEYCIFQNYDLQSPIKGRAVIVKNVIYDDETNMQKRGNAEWDAYRLHDVLKKLRFDVKMYVNQTYEVNVTGCNIFSYSIYVCRDVFFFEKRCTMHASAQCGDCNWHGPFSICSSTDKQRICINTQLESSKKQLKLDACVPKSNSFEQYAITCDVIAYHFVHFFSIWVIHKCIHTFNKKNMADIICYHKKRGVKK